MIKTVAWYEFWFAVRKKSWLIVTLGMPLLVLGYLGLISLIVAATIPGELTRQGKPTGIVDRSGLLTVDGAALADAVEGEIFELKIPGNKFENIPDNLKELTDKANVELEGENTESVVLIPDLEAGRKHINDESWKGIVVIPQDYLESGKVDVYTLRSSIFGSAMKTSWLSKTIRAEILKKAQLEETEIARVTKFANATEFEINDAGEFEKVNWLSKGLTLGVPLSVASLLIFALMINASALLASIAEEKENKVMEVIVSSVSADQLMFGKVLGIVVAGLVQIAIWMAMVSIIPISIQFAMNEFVDYEVNFGQLLISGIFMVMGFLFYGSLLAGMGSLGSTYKDCQQLSAAVIICACVPIMMPTVFVADPNSIVPRILSMVPMFSPIGMTLRLGSGDIAMWEVAVSFLILAVSTWFAIKISARLFRAGTLMRGKTPGMREIWKVLTQDG